MPQRHRLRAEPEQRECARGLFSAARGSALVVARPQLWEENHVSDVLLVRKQHDDAVDSQPEAASGRHAVLQGDQKVLVEGLRLVVACLTRAHLLDEALALHAWIVQL